MERLVRRLKDGDIRDGDAACLAVGYVLTVLALAAFTSCGGFPPPTPPTPTPTPSPSPPPTPTPTPSPTPSPTPTPGETCETSECRVAASCCAPDQGPDLGLIDEWTAITEAGIDRIVDESNGTVNGIIVRVFGGPRDHPQFRSHAEIRQSCRSMNERAMTCFVGLSDRWWGRHEEEGGDGCGITPEHVRRGEMNQCEIDRITGGVQACDGLNCVFETGNELALDSRTPQSIVTTFGLMTVAQAYDAGEITFAQMVSRVPLAQPDLRDWEQKVVGVICSVRPDAVLMTNAITGATDCDGGEIRLRSIHGHPLPGDDLVFPRQAIGSRTILTEGDNQTHGIESWRRMCQLMVDRGGHCGQWRGRHTREEWALRMEAMSHVGAPQPTPTPPPPPSECGSIEQWTCFSADDGKDTQGQLVHDSIEDVFAAAPPYIHSVGVNDKGELNGRIDSGNWGRYVLDVAAAVRARGTCAWEGDPTGRGKDDEILVEGEPGEQWDLLQGDDPRVVGPFVRINAFDCNLR